MIRDLTTISDCCRVAELEEEIWAYPDPQDVVPPAVLIVSAKRGGILLGAFDEDGQMCGFVYSIPGWKGGTPIQWSHMLGVSEAARGKGIARALKLAQRERALAMGIALVEWTYDPLQSVNAHFNFAGLGVVVEEYEENIYGESSSPLHRGTPTDRFVAAWHLRSERVERRIRSDHERALRDDSAGSLPVVNPSTARAGARAPGRGDLSLDAPRLLVEIPDGFSELQLRDPDLALAWRMATRQIFQTYFRRGYRAADFFFSRDTARGHYLLVRKDQK